MEQEMAAAADEDHHHIQGEDTQRREGYHGRDMLGEHLHDASDEWKRRQAAGEWRSPPVFFVCFCLLPWQARTFVLTTPRPKYTHALTKFLTIADVPQRLLVASLLLGGGNTTQSVKLGHYATTTSATTHQHDEPYLSQVEKDAKWAKDER